MLLSITLDLLLTQNSRLLGESFLESYERISLTLELAVVSFFSKVPTVLEREYTGSIPYQVLQIFENFKIFFKKIFKIVKIT